MTISSVSLSIGKTDSNSKFIDCRKLWTIKKTKWKRCGNLNEVKTKLTDTNYSGLKYMLINVGVNDTDENSGISVFNRLTEIIGYIKQKYKGIKIILGEITPRADNRDHEVVNCNNLINEFANTNTNIYIAHHENLRDEKNTFLHDNKHIKKDCLGRFAANLKKALRKAYGLEESYQQHKYNRNLGNYPNHRKFDNTMNPTTFQHNAYNKYSDGYTNNINYNTSSMETLKHDLRRKLLAIFDM